MAFLDFLLRRRPEASPEALGHFLHGQAAYVAQKTVLDYCRVKAGRSEKQLFADADFQAALSHCRWQVFFSALTDVTALVEAHLRPHAAGRDGQLAAALAPLHAAALLAEPPPAEELASAEDARETLPRHLASLQAAPVLPAHRLPLLAEPVLFATLPIHAEQRQGESLAIKGALRFQIVSTQQELERRFDAAETTRNLLDLH